jgi:hypothetical protein
MASTRTKMWEFKGYPLHKRSLLTVSEHKEKVSQCLQGEELANRPQT